MRDRVKMRLGGKEYDLLPSFGVVDRFEDRYYGLLDHLERLMQGKAVIQARAFLILEGLKAADPNKPWDFETVMERLFEAGYWHEDVVMKEAEFVERLIYTPEQYLAKKEERANEAKGLEEVLGAISKGSSE
jgi:hypothetical protein